MIHRSKKMLDNNGLIEGFPLFQPSPVFRPPSPALLNDLREPSFLRSYDGGRGLAGPLDRAARVLDLGVTVDRRVVRRVRVTGERRAGDLVPVSGRFDVVLH